MRQFKNVTGGQEACHLSRFFTVCKNYFSMSPEAMGGILLFIFELHPAKTVSPNPRIHAA